MNFEDKRFVSDKQEVTLSHLYKQMLNEKLTFGENILVCRILKAIAVEDIDIQNAVIGEYLFVDLGKKEPAENFMKI